MDKNASITQPTPNAQAAEQPGHSTGSSVQPAQPKKLAKTMTPDSVRRLLLKIADFDLAPDTIIGSVVALLDKYEKATGEQKNVIYSELNDKLKQAYALVALDKHQLLANIMDNDKYRTLTVEIANQLIAEYGCETVGEKMLAETASWAFCRMLECSQTLSGIHRVEYLSAEKTAFFAMLSKEVDRADRQYLSAIHSLRQIKQPPVSVTFKAHNAFIAHDQQINAKPSGMANEADNARQ